MKGYKKIVSLAGLKKWKGNGIYKYCTKPIKKWLRKNIKKYEFFEDYSGESGGSWTDRTHSVTTNESKFEITTTSTSSNVLDGGIDVVITTDDIIDLNEYDGIKELAKECVQKKCDKKLFAKIVKKYESWEIFYTIIKRFE